MIDLVFCVLNAGIILLLNKTTDMENSLQLYVNAKGKPGCSTSETANLSPFLSPIPTFVYVQELGLGLGFFIKAN